MAGIISNLRKNMRNLSRKTGNTISYTQFHQAIDGRIKVSKIDNYNLLIPSIRDYQKVKRFFNELQDDRERNFFFSRSRIYSDYEIKNFITNAKTDFFFVILDKQKVIGMILINSNKEISYGLLKEYEGKGLIIRSVKEILSPFKNKTIKAKVNKINVKSSATLTNLGFSVVKEDSLTFKDKKINYLFFEKKL